MPLYTALSMGIFFAGLGLPGLCGFIGEVLVVLSAWNFSGLLAVISAFVVILTAAYILWAIQRVYLGAEYKGPHGDEITPITLRETCVAAPLLILAVWFGVYPKVVFNYMDKTIDQQVTTLAEWTPTYVAQKEKEAAEEMLPATAQAADVRPQAVDVTGTDLTANDDITARDVTVDPRWMSTPCVQRPVSRQRPISRQPLMNGMYKSHRHQQPRRSAIDRKPRVHRGIKSVSCRVHGRHQGLVVAGWSWAVRTRVDSESDNFSDAAAEAISSHQPPERLLGDSRWFADRVVLCESRGTPQR